MTVSFRKSFFSPVVILAFTLSFTIGTAHRFSRLAQAQSQSGYVPAVINFQHPPLRYHGSDPTATQFLPANAVFGDPNGLAPPDLSPSDFMVPQQTLSGGSIDSFLPPEQTYLDPLLIDPYQVGGITDHKEGFYQRLGFTSTWIDRNDKLDDFGLLELDLLATFAVPLPTRDWPLLMTPTMKVRYLDGPGHVDLPPQVYETFFEFLWLPKFGERWTAIVGVAPGIYSDFEVDDNDAWRLTGTGLVRFDWNPGQTQLIFGILYLNRNDVRILPAGGVIWTPDAQRRYEFLFPRPKFAHRIAVGPSFEDWLYLGGEFGGNSYSIERIDGTVDVITLRDFRTYVGLQRKLNGGAGYHLEIGYVMGRVIEFESATLDVEADPTAMIRGGVTF